MSLPPGTGELTRCPVAVWVGCGGVNDCPEELHVHCCCAGGPGATGRCIGACSRDHCSARDPHGGAWAGDGICAPPGTLVLAEELVDHPPEQ